jgi:hypothetical protein
MNALLALVQLDNRWPLGAIFKNYMQLLDKNAKPLVQNKYWMVHTPGASTSVMYDNYDNCVHACKVYCDQNPGRTFVVLEVVQAFTKGVPGDRLGNEQGTLQ